MSKPNLSRCKTRMDLLLITNDFLYIAVRSCHYHLMYKTSGTNNLLLCHIVVLHYEQRDYHT